jgi:uncharacterized membrane protein
MSLKIFDLISIVLLTLVSGMYWGPYWAFTKSLNTFKPDVLLTNVDRLNKNMEPLMTALTPVALLSTVPILWLSWGVQMWTFYLTLAALVLFVITLLVTMFVEVPIVRQIISWTPSTLPDNWQKLRDRWVSFHLARIIPSLIGLVLLLVGAIF